MYKCVICSSRLKPQRTIQNDNFITYKCNKIQCTDDGLYIKKNIITNKIVFISIVINLNNSRYLFTTDYIDNISIIYNVQIIFKPYKVYEGNILLPQVDNNFILNTKNIVERILKLKLYG